MHADTRNDRSSRSRDIGWRKLQSLAAVVAVSSTVALGAGDAAAAAPNVGVYAGSTGQGNAITIKVTRSWLSGSFFVLRISVTGTAACDYGLPPEEAGYSGILSGVTVRNGRFRIQLSMLDLRGHFVTRNRVEGRLTLRDSWCETTSIPFHAKRR